MKKYYHFSNFEGTCFQFIDEKEISSYDSEVNAYGPFNTFTECKKDALEYHRTTKKTAQMAINEIKNTTIKEIT